MKGEDRYHDLKNLLFLFFLVFTSCFFIFIYLWRNVQMANLENEIDRMNQEKKKLRLEVESLHVSISSNTTPEKIQKILAENEIYLPVRPGKKIVSVKLPPLQTEVAGDSSKKEDPTPEQPEKTNPGSGGARP